MGVFSKLAGGGIAKYAGILVMVATIIPAIYKTCSVTVHQGETAYLIWRGKAITHGHFMYPIRDLTRLMVPWMPRMPRYVYPPRPRSAGRHWHVPIFSRFQIENTANRTHDTEIKFSRYDPAQECEVNHTLEGQVVWGQEREPIPNPFYIPRDLPDDEMARALVWAESQVGPLTGDIRHLLHEMYIYPWGALFNGVHYEAGALGLIKAALFNVCSNPEFPQRKLRDENAIYEAAEAICRNRLLLLYASRLHEFHISDTAPVPMQTGLLASAIRSLRSTVTGKVAARRALRGVAALFKSS